MMQAAMPQEARASYLVRVPMSRVGKPEEVAALVGLLASERFGFGTGQVVYIDGGLSLGARYGAAFQGQAKGCGVSNDFRLPNSKRSGNEE
jgi:hypothetical protein